MAKITIKDNSGKKIADFSANGDDPISTQGQENDVEIPVACGVGVCGSCKGKCSKGGEFIDNTKFVIAYSFMYSFIFLIIQYSNSYLYCISLLHFVLLLLFLRLLEV